MGDYVSLAEAAVKEKKYDQARKYYLRILEISPDRIDLRYNVLTMDLRLSDWEGALRLADDLLAQDPANSIVLEHKAYVLANQKKYADAYVLYGKVFELGLRRVSVVENLQVLAGKLDKQGDAFRWGEELYKLGKKESVNLAGLIASGLNSGQNDAANPYIKEYTEANAGKPDQLLILGEIYINAKCFSQAIDLAAGLLDAEKPYLEAWPVKVKALILMGAENPVIQEEVEAYMGEIPDAADRLRELIKSLPDDKKAGLQQILDAKKTPTPEGAGAEKNK